MNKELRKEVMIKSKLKNICNRDKSDASYSADNKQRNKCTNLLRKAKRTFYNYLNPSLMLDNKTFWKTVKTFFSDKNPSNESITLIDNNLISDDSKIAETFTDFFTKAVKNLNSNTDHIGNPIEKAIPVQIMSDK